MADTRLPLAQSEPANLMTSANLVLLIPGVRLCDSADLPLLHGAGVGQAQGISNPISLSSSAQANSIPQNQLAGPSTAVQQMGGAEIPPDHPDYDQGYDEFLDGLEEPDEPDIRRRAEP